MKILNINNRGDCAAADDVDPLRKFRELFLIPKGTYFMGNSLGLCPRAAEKAVSNFIVSEWGANGIEGWNKCNWLSYPRMIGDKIGKLIGAEDSETIILESTSASIFKCLTTSIAIQKIDNLHRSVIVVERDNFPTDNYVVEGLLALINQGYEMRFFDNEENPLEKTVGGDTAVVLLSLVNYRTGQLHDMTAITSLAHRVKALIIWDLCHATGAVPINVKESDADFAVGCSYKYLNGGAGAPSFLYANKRHHDRVSHGLTGWFGHASPFEMKHTYTPAKGIDQFLTGTPNILPMVVINCSIDIFLQTDMKIIREKSLQLGDLFIELLEEKCPSLKLITPKMHDKRGSHISFFHENGLNISKLLREHKIICDYRHPSIIRFSMTPLYLRFIDIFDSVDVICCAVKSAPTEIINNVNGIT